MSDTNSEMADNVKGIVNPLNFAGAANNKARVRLLRDTVAKEHTDQTDHRLFLDEMSPACRDSLYAMLNAMEAAVTN